MISKIFKIPIHIKKKMNIILSVVLLFILIAPRELWDRRYGQFNFSFVVFPIITMLLILVASANFIEKKRNFSKWIKSNIMVILFAASVLIATIVSADRAISIIYLPYYFSGIFLVFLITASELTFEKIRFILGVAIFCLSVTAVYAIIQRIQGVNVNASYTNLSVNPDMPGRVESFFGNPNVYGFVLAPLLPITAAYILTCKSRWSIIFGSVSFLLGIAALVMTYSRGAWIASAAGMFLLIAMYKPKLIPVMIILCLAAIPFLPSNIKHRILTIFNPNDTSISYRALLMSCAVRLIADHPIFGAGPGVEIIQTLVHQNYWPSDLDPKYRFVHSHNTVLQLLCETGALGCAAFLGAVIHNIFGACRGLYKKNMSVRIITASLISGMIAMILCGIADSPLTTMRTMLLFWMLFGLTASIKEAE